MKQLREYLRLVAVCGLIVLILTPTRARAETANLTIKVMTLNLHNGKDSNQLSNFDRFAQLVALEQPDVISLQEVQVKHLNLLQSAGYQAIAGPNANHAFFRFGNALLTRHKIIYHRHHYLPSQKEQRGVDEVLLDLGGSSLRVLNTHIGLGQTEQQRQIDEIVRICGYLTGPLIITGDFNFEPTSKLLAGFPLREVSAVLGGYKTFPAKRPRYQIDQIWYSPEFFPLKARPLNWDGSDHLPVMASLVLKTTTVLPRDPVAIPDPTLRHNPLLPDVGDISPQITLSGLHNPSAGHKAVSGALEVPLTRRYRLTCGYDGTDLFLGFTYKQTIDLRDYFSLAGVRGKAEWNFTVAGSDADDLWLEWRQYYRWSNRWGSNIMLSNQEDQPHCLWEQDYLPREKFRLQFGADSDFHLRAGIAFSPDQRQVFKVQYLQTDDDDQYRFGWECRWK
jgi:endonuclease/exonuclease/phosphatase family metal-dependent hydrolase